MSLHRKIGCHLKLVCLQISESNYALQIKAIIVNTNWTYRKQCSFWTCKQIRTGSLIQVSMVTKTDNSEYAEYFETFPTSLDGHFFCTLFFYWNSGWNRGSVAFIILTPWVTQNVFISVSIFVTFIYRKKKRKKRQPREYTMSQYPEPPPPDRVEARYREERQLARLREVKEKQDLILQRRKYVQCVQILRGFRSFKPKVTVKNWGGDFWPWTVVTIQKNALTVEVQLYLNLGTLTMDFCTTDQYFVNENRQKLIPFYLRLD